jgi:membrane-bound lytic murein transglycosylase A
MRRSFFILALLGLAACSLPSLTGGGGGPSGPDKLVLQPVAFSQIPAWGEDNRADALATFIKSCGAFDRMQDNDATGEGDLLAPAVVWRELCRKAESVPPGDNALAKRYFEEYFVPARATNNGNPAGLITGYYEPLLKGSRVQQRPYVYPVYGPPDPGTPSYPRSQIDLGILAGHAPVIAYVDDPVRLFFMHVQGSGRILMPDNTILRVGYAASNGQPYTAIGKVLVDRGLLNKEQVTMPLLRQWLYDHPDDMWKVMWENRSYIFFREMQGDPVGTEQVPLTPGRSLAVDMRFIPLGMPVYLDTVLPELPDSPMAIHRRLMIAQDSGGAIKGPTRADIFFGYGAAAEQVAGRMKAGGTLTLLIPRALARTVLGQP